MEREQRNNKNQKNRGKGRALGYFLTILCLLGAAAGTVMIVMRKAEQKRVEDELRALAEYTYLESLKAEPAPDTTPEPDMEENPVETADGRTPLERDLAFIEEQGIPLPEKNIDFEELQTGTNEDIYAWIYVPDTLIDYPVLQHATDNAYYLDYNIDGTKGYPGCIYTENLNQKDFTDFNTVLYGHNMKNGTMFANLHKFEDSEFFDEHPYVYIYTPDRLLVYGVYAAYEFSNIHLLLGYDTESRYGISSYLKEVRYVRDMNRNLREELFPDTDQHIITLSTCIRNKHQSRYLVQGVLLNEN